VTSHEPSLFDDPVKAAEPPRMTTYAKNPTDREKRLALQHQILQALRKSPATCEQLCKRLNAKHQSVSPALLHLRREQLIEWNGKSRTSTGHTANICHITGKGLKLLMGGE